MGTFPSENIHINPIPLPENFLQLNPEERQIAMEIYLDEERMNLKNLLEQIDKTNRRNLEKLSDLIDTSPIFTPNPVGFQKDENNLKDVQAEITRSPQYNVENTKSSPEGTFYDDITNLGHIIDVPQTRESQWFQRLSRSLNQTDGDKLDKLLLAEKSVINELKKDAKHDEDLMMIGYIGESMIKDLEKGKNETKRTKREIAGSPYNSGLNR